MKLKNLALNTFYVFIFNYFTFRIINVKYDYFIFSSFKGFFNDLSRLGINNFKIEIEFVSLVASSIFIAIYYFSKIDKKFKLFATFSIYLFSYIFTLYIFRIFNFSRFYLIIFSIVFCLYFYIVEEKKETKIYTLVAISIISILALYFLNTEDVQTATDTSESEERIQRYLNEKEYIGEFGLGNEYIIKKYSICCIDFAHNFNSLKTNGYLKSIDNNLIYVNGYGDIFYTNKQDLLEKNILNFKHINSNLEKLIKNKNIFLSDWESIKDVEIIDNKIHLSFVEEIEQNCISNAILEGDFNYSNISFTFLFKNNECISRNSDNFNATRTGGKLMNLDTNYLALTTGDIADFSKPQNLESIFGKVLKINKVNGEYEVLSYGHRNSQGLVKTKNKNLLISTEHGPKGGDEINLININNIENFGWPISSYGFPYGGSQDEPSSLPEAPMYNSHKEYGFKEPIYSFYYEVTGSHGISDIEINYFKEGDIFFVAVLAGNVLYEVDINLDNESVNKIQTFRINERIRDIEYDKDHNVYYLLCETTPSLIILSTSN